MSVYRYMRVLLFFDLPRETHSERKSAAKFRKDLLEDGFLMLQESVYCKLALNATAVELLKNRVKKYMPKKGSIMILTVTEKQFGMMDFCLGEFSSNVLDSDSKLVIV